MERVLILAALIATASACLAESSRKTASVFFPASLRQAAAQNCAKYAWAQRMRQKLIDDARPWLRMTDDDLWSLMFGPTITRSWMVWSNGFCPSCKEGVPMYNWEVDPLGRPWKVKCPHCDVLFPTNDFAAFYRSGLDEHGVFQRSRADDSLLFNSEHPDSGDPLRSFGVDDGEGYVDGDRRWRFIGAYLIYGQWKKAIVDGITALSGAYSATGDPAFAHKAGVMLDRVADVYPGFDFGEQGLVYEVKGRAGYVSTWHDACVETRYLAFAYDQVFDAIKEDAELVRFLSAKARKYRLDNPKASFADIQRNIEDRILNDAVTSRAKIESNYPQTDFTIAVIRTVLGWPGSRAEVQSMLEAVLEKATAVDGLTGEKGLAGYTAFSPQAVASVLEQYARFDPEFFTALMTSRPKLYDGYRFFVDAHCLHRYYPNSGDSGAFGQPQPGYAGAGFSRQPGIWPSGYGFMWRMYEATGDPAFVQILYRENGSSVDDLPHDLFARDPEKLQQAVKRVIDREGPTPAQRSVDHREWRLALLRSGKANNERVLVLDYDSLGNHSHADGMNLGLFGKGLDLLPDFGYPPVQYGGGWHSPRAKWYTQTAAHNTVVVDGADQPRVEGANTLWAEGDALRAIRASAPAMIGGKQYERTLALVDVSEREGYVLDVFRVVGGTEHAKFLRSAAGTLRTSGFNPTPIPTWRGIEHMRSMTEDPSPQPGWYVDWAIEDSFGVLPEGADVHLRCTELTSVASASLGECWITLDFDNYDERWVPQLMVRRQSDSEPLVSTFVSLLEPYEGQAIIARARRLEVRTLNGVAYPDSTVAVEVTLADGRRDLLLCADVENPLALRPAYSSSNALVVPEWGVELRGEMCLVRRERAGTLERAAVYGGSLTVDGREIAPAEGSQFVEMTRKR